jgi:chromosome segregation ATPase
MPGDQQVVEAFITALRSLASDDNYKAIASVFDEVPLLKGQVEYKNAELDTIGEEIARLKTRHKDRIQEDLELYRTQRNKLEEAKAKLERDVTAQKSVVKEGDNAIAKLNQRQKTMQGELDLAKKSIDEEKKKVENANTGIIELQQTLKSKNTEINKLKEELRKGGVKVSNVEDQLQAVQKENVSLKQTLQLNKARLQELEGFATKLHDEDDEIW